MPISSRTDPSNDLTVFTASGVLTFEEQMAAFKEFYEGEPTKNVVLDLRNITGKRISSDELRRIIAFIKLHKDKRGPGKTALIAKTDLDFGLSRMSDALAESEGVPWKIRAFRSMGDAVKWLTEG